MSFVRTLTCGCGDEGKEMFCADCGGDKLVCIDCRQHRDSQRDRLLAALRDASAMIKAVSDDGLPGTYYEWQALIAEIEGK